MSVSHLAIDLCDSDDGDDIPPPSGLTTSNPTRTSTTTTTTERVRDRASVSPTPRKKAKPTKSFALIWVCTHGKGRSRNWRKKDLKLVGVYASKANAEEAKRKVMSEHECYGHGDICVGGTWEDEIDLVIREAPLFL